MGRMRMVTTIGLVWALFTLFTGCALTEKWTNSTIKSQNQKIEYLTAQLEAKNKQIRHLTGQVGFKHKMIHRMTARRRKAREDYLALKKEVKALKIDSVRLTDANSKLQQHNLELTLKIDMLKLLDHRVEEKRQNYSSE